jgi:hypothetical protein
MHDAKHELGFPSDVVVAICNLVPISVDEIDDVKVRSIELMQWSWIRDPIGVNQIIHANQ